MLIREFQLALTKAAVDGVVVVAAEKDLVQQEVEVARPGRRRVNLRSMVCLHNILFHAFLAYQWTLNT